MQEECGEASRDRAASGGGAVWLVGMMGAGKSTVGPVLARALGRPFIDTDEAIEADAGCSVAELFARDGEAAFRERERAAMRQAAGCGAVVALGGGAIAQPGAAAWLAERGIVVYLRATPATLLARIGDAGSRPLLAGLSPNEREARLAALLREREPAYATARVVVDVDGAWDTEATARRIAERVADVLSATCQRATP